MRFWVNPSTTSNLPIISSHDDRVLDDTPTETTVVVVSKGIEHTPFLGIENAVAYWLYAMDVSGLCW